MLTTNDKLLEFVGSSLKDLRDLPDAVRRKAGAELRLVQQGERPDSAENVEGYAGNSVLKLKLLYDTDTYRVVYTVQFQEVVFVLHVFMKKAHTEDKTPQKELNTIAARLKTAQTRYEEMKNAEKQHQSNVKARQQRK